MTSTFAHGYLPVSHGHRLYYPETGNPQGIPLLFLHGGPGSGCNPAHAHLLYPQGFRLIMFDQRGCGLSTPRGWLLNNTTQAILSDIEALRHHLNIQQWAVYGGSWGATLALEYAKQFTPYISALLLRGTFLARREDWVWFSFPNGVAKQHAPEYTQLLSALKTRWGQDPMLRLYSLLTNPDLPAEIAYRAALAWDRWEATVMGISPPAFNPDSSTWPARIERIRVYTHYAYHHFFLPADGVLPGIDALRHLPIMAVHGLNDKVCRYQNLQVLGHYLPEMGCWPVAAGHGLHEPHLQAALSQAATRLHTSLLAT